MRIIPPFLSGFPWTDPLYPTVQPFTNRDGTTYLEILRALDKYVKELAAILNEINAEVEANLNKQITELQAAINSALAEQAEQVNTALTEQEARVAEQLANAAADVAAQLAAQSAEVQRILTDLTNASIEFSDPVLKAIAGDNSTESRQLLDRLYNRRTVHLILAWGQSNMAGRGPIGDRGFNYVPDSRIMEFGANVRALEPAKPWLDHIDGRIYNLGPAYDFALKRATELPQTDSIVIVPSAEGGSGLVRTTSPTWNPTVADSLYHRAIAQTEQAISAILAQTPDVNIAIDAMIWHQGEADNTLTDYIRTFTDMATRLRAHFGMVPIVIGQMWYERILADSWLPHQAHAQLASNLPFCSFARVDETSAYNIGDATHFSERGAQHLAGRMFTAYQAARVNEQPPGRLAAAANQPMSRLDNSVPLGLVEADIYGGRLKTFGSTISNPGRFIRMSGGITLDPANTGAGTTFLLFDPGYTTGYEFRRQLFSGYGGSNVIVVSFTNVYDYIFIQELGGKFVLRRRNNGVTETLATSELAFTPSEIGIRISGRTISGRHVANNLAFGGTFDGYVLPESYTLGGMHGMGIPVAEAGLTFINNMTFVPIVDRI